MIDVARTETWLPVPIGDLADHYEVSSFGRVRHSKHKRVLKPRLGRNDYQVVWLRSPSCRRGKNYRVHRLVAIAFFGEDSDEQRNEVNHLDWDKSNNRIDNLEWVSTEENIAHRDVRKIEEEFAEW